MGLTLWQVLNCVGVRAARRRTPYSTRQEVADELVRSRDEIDPLFAEAIMDGYLDEDPKYPGHFYKLSDSGQEFVDQPAFLPPR